MRRASSRRSSRLMVRTFPLKSWRIIWIDRRNRVKITDSVPESRCSLGSDRLRSPRSYAPTTAALNSPPESRCTSCNERPRCLRIDRSRPPTMSLYEAVTWLLPPPRAAPDCCPCPLREQWPRCALMLATHSEHRPALRSAAPPAALARRRGRFPRRRKGTKRLFLFPGEAGRDFDDHLHQQITPPRS